MSYSKKQNGPTNQHNRYIAVQCASNINIKQSPVCPVTDMNNTPGQVKTRDRNQFGEI